MTTITKNHGCGDGSGRWLFEDFLLKDGRRGRFVVSYRTHYFDMRLEPEWRSRWRFEANDRVILWSESVVYDSEGNTVLSGPVVFMVASEASKAAEIESQVLEAFRNDIDEVEVYERDYR